MHQSRATVIGFLAVLSWSLLALLTIGAAPVPPLLMNAVCFGLGAAVGLVWMARRGFGVLRGVPWRAYVFGVAGLFGYHFIYFTAFRISPSAFTGLIAYLWPLLIVLFSALLPQERLTPRHMIGALVAFAGAALVVLGGADRALHPTALALALLCAVIWAGYSVGSRRFGTVPSAAVTVYCAGTALLSALAHLAFEDTLWPQGAIGWASLIGLGIGPLGIAFFAWDIGVKRGNIQLLGVASFAAPLLSTLILVAVGISPATWTLAMAAVLIAAGAFIAARPTKTPADSPP